MSVWCFTVQCNVSIVFSILTKWSYSSSQSQTRLVQDMERDLIICTRHELQCHFFLDITDISWYYSLQQEESICVCAITITINTRISRRVTIVTWCHNCDAVCHNCVTGVSQLCHGGVTIVTRKCIFNSG